ncbi:MAG: NAD(P)H-dependent oxidoreductase [Frankiaceae bacterium]|jgi:multimeric flavodoxin WrbA|nr:NAD(P)H-dependent oxidoreductase [Frankiaceae bacterium]
MPLVLIVHHTASPAMQELLESAVAGAKTDDIGGVDVAVRPALAATASDVLAADGFVLGTPVNIGYISGALKHFFDQIYYPTLQAKAGAPWAGYLHANSDAAGALRALDAITAGLGWTKVAAPLVCLGAPDRAAKQQAWDLGATVAAHAAGLA